MNYIKIAIAALGVVGLVAIAVFLRQSGIKAVEVKYQKAAIEQQAKAQATERELNTLLSKANENKKNEIKAVNDKLASALRSLQQRTSRTDNSTVACIGQTATGSQLYREDAEFLAREAARADQLIIERDYYYERYEDARKSLARQE